MTNIEEAICRAFRKLCYETNNMNVYFQLKKEVDFIKEQNEQHEKFLDSLEDEVNPSGQD